jgi:hypothetical protein
MSRYARNHRRIISGFFCALAFLQSVTAGNWTGSWQYSAALAYVTPNYRISHSGTVTWRIVTQYDLDISAEDWSAWSLAIGPFTTTDLSNASYTSANVTYKHDTRTGRRWKVQVDTGSGNWIDSDSVEVTAPGLNNKPSSLYLYLAATPPTPEPYRLHEIVKNTSNTRRDYELDANGDGVIDYRFSLGPGEEFTIELSFDTEPTNPAVLTFRDYLGDGQYGTTELESWAPGEWTQSEDPIPAGETVNHGTTLPQTDTQSSDPTKQRVTYAEPSGGSVSESTFKTGIEALRTTQVEGSDKAAEAIDKLRKEQKEQLGYGPDEVQAPARISAAQTAADARQAEMKTAFAGFTNSVGSRLGFQGMPAASGPDWGITIGGIFADFNPTATWGPLAGTLRSLIAWGMWAVFLGYVVTHSTQVIKEAAIAPQAVSSSTLPGISSGVALAAAVGICAVVAVLAAGLFVVVLNVTLPAVFGGLFDWQASPWLPNAIWFLEFWVPWQTCVALISASLIFHVSADGLAVAAMAGIRAFGV